MGCSSQAFVIGDLRAFAENRRAGCARLDGHSLVVVTSHEVAPASQGQERVVAEFRARSGEVGGYHASMRLLLLTTTGARTGQRRAVPLTYLPDGGRRYVVTAGNAGSGSHPAWYYNLAANPAVTVEAGNEAFEAVAVIAEEAERTALYQRFAVAYPQLDGYQEQTTRQIPLVILTRR
jgi:deazaflavin-dependent oxidoreductase (nitroreductase family)